MAGTGTNLAEPIPTLARTNATGAAGCRPRESRIMRDTLIKTDSPMDRLRSRRTVAMKSTATALSSAEQQELKEVLGVPMDFVDDEVFHTNSLYARGVDNLVSAPQMLELAPLGRQEDWEDSPAGWPQQPTYG